MKNHNSRPGDASSLAHNPLPFLRPPPYSRVWVSHPLPLNAAQNFPSSHPRNSLPVVPSLFSSSRVALRSRCICSHQARTYIISPVPNVLIEPRSSAPFLRPLSLKSPRENRIVESRPTRSHGCSILSLFSVWEIYKSPVSLGSFVAH